MRASLAARAAGLLARLRKRPLHWATWLLAAIPFFVAPPLLAIALAVAARRRQGIDPVMLTVAVANIVLSLYFWHAVGDSYAEWVQLAVDWLFGLSVPDPIPTDRSLTVSGIVRP